MSRRSPKTRNEICIYFCNGDGGKVFHKVRVPADHRTKGKPDEELECCWNCCESQRTREIGTQYAAAALTPGTLFYNSDPAAAVVGHFNYPKMIAPRSLVYYEWSF